MTRTEMLLQRALLLAPDSLARAAASRAREPRERWLLRQPRAVRESYVREVLPATDAVRQGEIWMLRQPEAVRESYVREVLGG